MIDRIKVGMLTPGKLNSCVIGLNEPPLYDAEELKLGEDGYFGFEGFVARDHELYHEGVVELTTPKGRLYLPFEVNAERVPSTIAVVAPTKMNMFYVGVDNPVEVGVPGYPNNLVRVSLSAGTIDSLGNGMYTVRVERPGTTKVNVAVKTDIGLKMIGSKEFRVSRIPDPKVLLGPRQGPVISAGEIKSMIGLVAVADNFPFDVRFSLKSFDVTYQSAGDSVMTEISNAGAIFSEEVKALLRQCQAGDRVWFEDIKVEAPDGTTRTSDLSFKVIE